MRDAGRFLLILGFVWLVWCEWSVGAVSRGVAIENFAKYSPEKTYSAEEVDDAIRGFVTDYQKYHHKVVIPAILMLAGGVLVDRAARRKEEYRES